MIHFMLNDLSRPAGEVFRACLHFQGLILHLDILISLTFTGAAEKRQTAFLGVVCAVLLDDLGIEHHCICGSSSALVEKGDDALAHTQSYLLPCRHSCLCEPSAYPTNPVLPADLLSLRIPTSLQERWNHVLNF